MTDRKNPQQRAQDRAARQAQLSSLSSGERAGGSDRDASRASGSLSGARKRPGRFGVTTVGSAFFFSR